MSNNARSHCVQAQHDRTRSSIHRRYNDPGASQLRDGRIGSPWQSRRSLFFHTNITSYPLHDFGSPSWLILKWKFDWRYPQYPKLKSTGSQWLERCSFCCRWHAPIYRFLSAALAFELLAHHFQWLSCIDPAFWALKRVPAAHHLLLYSGLLLALVYTMRRIAEPTWLIMVIVKLRIIRGENGLCRESGNMADVEGSQA